MKLIMTAIALAIAAPALAQTAADPHAAHKGHAPAAPIMAMATRPGTAATRAAMAARHPIAAIRPRRRPRTRPAQRRGTTPTAIDGSTLSSREGAVTASSRPCTGPQRAVGTL
jgi:hypothetical protein